MHRPIGACDLAAERDSGTAGAREEPAELLREYDRLVALRLGLSARWVLFGGYSPTSRLRTTPWDGGLHAVREQCHC